MRNISMRYKLLVAFLALSIIPIAVSSAITYVRMSATLDRLAMESVAAIAERKADKVTTFLETAMNEIRLIAQGNTAKEAIGALKARSEAGAAGVPLSDATLKQVDAFFRASLSVTGFEDFLIVSAEHGRVLYSASKGADLGTDLDKGPYRDSNLARLWKTVVETGKPTIVDFAFYAPANRITSFIGAPAVDAGGKVTAVIAFELYGKRINAIMQKASGMGKTGESYLLGPDYLMRTQSRLTGDDTILKREVRSYGAEQALAGKTGQAVYDDYRGVEVVGYYAPIPGTPWVMLSEIDMEEVDQPVNALRNMLLLITLLSAAAVLVVSVIVARQIERPLVALTEASKTVASGDLRTTIAVVSDDEIGQVAASFNTMVKGLLQMTREVRNVSEGVSTASEELSSSAEELNATSEEMSQAIQQIAKGAESTSQQLADSTKTVMEMTKIAGEVLTATRSASKSAEQAIGTAQSGAQAAKDAKERINHVFEVVRESAEGAKNLGVRARQITEIVGTITGFADQTNLLALNAAIEAARAGEAGRGFAVVAEEVRKLAESSGQAAKEIGVLIGTIRDEVDAAVATMEKGFEEVHAGRDVIVEAGSALEGLAGTVEQNAAMFAQIQQFNERMGEAAKDVMRTFESIAAMAEQSASATEETSASTEEMTASMQELSSSAQELADMAARLQKEIARFRVE